MLEVFFRVFYHPLHRFFLCDRLNAMAKCAIITDSSIIAKQISEMAAGTHKKEYFPIPRVLMVRVSMKEAIFDGLSTKEDIMTIITLGVGNVSVLCVPAAV